MDWGAKNLFTDKIQVVDENCIEVLPYFEPRKPHQNSQIIRATFFRKIREEILRFLRRTVMQKRHRFFSDALPENRIPPDHSHTEQPFQFHRIARERSYLKYIYMPIFPIFAILEQHDTLILVTDLKH